MLGANKTLCNYFGGTAYNILRRCICNNSINGENATAVVLGGLGSTERHLNKYSSLYKKYNFTVFPVLSRAKDLITPTVISCRGKQLALEL